MKTILVPTDYSDAANNALKYAVELAKFTRAKLVLFHAYHLPVPVTEVPVVVITPRELEKENLETLRNLEQKIRDETSGAIDVESAVRPGLVSDEVETQAREYSADLVVMGIRGSGSKVAQALIGSNTVTVIKKSTVPVLAVPEEAAFKKIEKIALAFDYHGEAGKETLQLLKKFIRLFNAKLLVVDVVAPVETPTFENAVAGVKLENALEDIPHQLFFPASDNIRDELNDFTGVHACDWIVMMPHRHSFLSGLFHKSQTKKMAFHTHIPLLSLPA